MLPVILAIDTSNYTTSAAYSSPDMGYVSGGFLIQQKKQLLRVREGERGLRQSDALFAHTCNLPPILEELLSTLPENAYIAAVGCSTTPRRAEGSYMPCFLAGENVARGIAAAMKVPFYAFSHQEGHIAAAAYSAVYAPEGQLGRPATDSCDTALSDAPFLAFHVSGGTTDLLRVVPGNGRYEITMLGTSLDLHAGQVIDRIGVMLGMQFPCGPALAALAKQYTEKRPSPKICVKGCDCNLSGLENQAQKLHADGKSDAEVAAYVFAFIEKTLLKMTENALAAYPDHAVLYAGGVMSNMLMRKNLTKFCADHHSRAYFSAPVFSSDNAVGTSLLACRAFLADQMK
ncbi:MAG: peptidase M22 [Oscillospiraceae bacterium]|nr:peptidase M22 [Oscillospiraceae bacterium]